VTEREIAPQIDVFRKESLLGRGARIAREEHAEGAVAQKKGD
jgi:hypothetical protein